MPITWDAPLTATVARELGARLGTGPGGARLRAFHLDHDAASLLLWFREATLVARLDPAAGALLLLDPADPIEDARPLSAELLGVESPPDDRLLLLEVRKVQGSRSRFLFAIELITNRWNVVVSEGPERRIRHLLRESEGGARPLAVGGTWQPPPPSEREGKDGELPLERWREILTPVPPPERRGALLSRVAWTSTLNAPTLLMGDGFMGDGFMGADGPEPESDPERLAEGHRRWREIARCALGERPADPVILRGAEGPQPYPLPLAGAGGATGSEPAEGLLDAFARAAEEADVGAGAAIPSAWVDRLAHRADRARGKAKGLARELAGTPDPAETRAIGNLLLARFHEVPTGEARARLTDFSGEEVEVELDPALSPQENAEAYYARARKAERARERLPRMITEAEEEDERLTSLLERVRAGDAGAEEVEAELPRREETSASSTESADEASRPYRRYRSSGGIEIRVGRGARHNDDLTFHHSRPDDVWLHARHAAGAHVILRWDREGSPPARDLAEAAVLAAVHSKARTSGSAPVDWTRRKYVRKPRKAPPGAVVPDRVETLFVEPDDSVEERLRAE